MKHALSNKRIFLIIWIVVGTIISVLKYNASVIPDGKTNPGLDVRFNNYLIFKESYNNLVDKKNLYEKHRSHYFDLYKYSPTFAFAMGLFKWFNLFTGLLIWDLLNVVVFALGLIKLNLHRTRYNYVLLLLMLIVAVNSIQNTQSNLLMAGLLMLCFYYIEKRKVYLSVAMLLATVFIKIFGIVASVLYMLYKPKIKIALAYLLLSVVFIALPLLVTDFSNLSDQYINWLEMLKMDKQASYGDSVYGLINRITGIHFDANYLLIFSGLLLMLPLTNFKQFSSTIFRSNYLALILIYMVVFNHKAESATYILAITGICIWFMNRKPTQTDFVLLGLTFLLSVLPITDLYPDIIKKDIILAYKLKVLPCLIIWIIILYNMLDPKRIVSVFNKKDA